MSKIQQKQRKVLKSRLFVRVRVRVRLTRKVPKLNNSEDVKYLSLCQKRRRTSRKKTKKDKIIVLIDLAVLQSVTLLFCGTYLQW